VRPDSAPNGRITYRVEVLHGLGPELVLNYWTSLQIAKEAVETGINDANCSLEILIAAEEDVPLPILESFLGMSGQR
jgi:hypothetical protein